MTNIIIAAGIALIIGMVGTRCGSGSSTGWATAR